MVLTSHYDPTMIGEIIEVERVTHAPGVPTMILGLLEAYSAAPFDTSSLHHVVCGGAMVAPALFSRVKEQFGSSVAVFYDQTEYCPITNMHNLGDTLEDICATFGPPMPHTEISIRRASDNSVADIGEIGEVCARGPCTMSKYHNNPDATDAAIDTEGWLHTGDLRVLDPRGYLAVTGRLKEMIIRGGENLYPAEIENALTKHPGVAEVAVVGLPDANWGEIVAAFIRPEVGHSMTSTALKVYCRERVSPQKTPSIWRIVDAFPVTASGKVQKYKLVESADSFADMTA